ncbi:cupin domain-containing protein [Anabaena sp. UHCC 0187]|uniref:cupin domain-containing protein n=1 Tax=Anabaena sp. UHCC 0187 TaxID=2590018 RepID=UPI001447A94F|nr:cupin domain-containing protein [Anabaena sp. UHCC 0187]MTJ15224.1 cupin domain-containing protein [Anabaena sp. UHCC 0187]
MFIVHSDSIFKVDPNTPPEYNRGNPLLKLLNFLERAQLAAEREFYLTDQLQYLFPYQSLVFYGPQGADANILDPTQQDNKTDFQKQNVKDFYSTDTFLVRGLVTVGDWTGPFLRISYRGGPDSQLSVAAGNKLGEKIKLWVKVGDVATPMLITVPYNERSDRYEVEFWGYPGNDLRSQLDDKGRNSIDRGELQVRTDLVHGNISDFNREGLNDRLMTQVAPTNTMHPILPLHVELAWADFTEKFWDSQNGANYHYEFNMIMRGWDNFLGTGISPNPHGGIGFLEYRNLMSNYGQYTGKNELGRQLNSWNFSAFRNKNHGNDFEPFFAVDYMDLHLLNSNCGIGLHRHRDNQEVFFMMEGQGFMVVGDWCKMPERERCFEIRTLKSGHMAMLKGGNLHALMNSTDEQISLFMFGGYD